jgi:hypothetical protein
MPHPVKELHSIMPIANIPSVLKRGILSYERCLKLPHADVSMVEVQDKRDQVQVPGGLRLHKYANVYFHARNPMMYKRREHAERLCILKVSIDILQLEKVVITDQNASSDYVKFMPPSDLNTLDFNKIYAGDWRHPGNQIEYWRHKSIKCAEVLVPNGIDPSYIKGAYVVSAAAKNLLKEQGFTLSIKIEPDLFFCLKPLIAGSHD